MKTRNHATAALMLSLVNAMGCDALVGPGYPGEPLLTVSGTVHNELSEATAADVAIVWAAGHVGDNNVAYPIAESVSVTGSFPAAFTIDVYVPPADDAFLIFNDEPDAKLAVGFIVALPAGGSDEGEVDREDFLGLTQDVAVIYVGNETALAHARASLAGDLQLGYNLISTHPDQMEDSAWENCVYPLPIQSDECIAACNNEDNGCQEACIVDYQAAVNECNQAREMTMPMDTSIQLALGPDAFTGSLLEQVFNLQGDGPTEEPSDEPAAE